MKNRVRKITNFFAFNLLFFALYLNFIHKDNNAMPVTNAQKTTTAFSGTTENSVQFVQKTDVAQEAANNQSESAPLKLSIN
jgi:hypothetical protein